MVDLITKSGNYVLKDDCSVEFFYDFLTEELSNKYFNLLVNDLEWENAKSIGYGKQKRLAMWYGALDFNYSGIKHGSNTNWHSALDEILKKVIAITGVQYNCALVNHYASGEVSVGLHADDEDIFDPVSICGVSLGASRNINFIHNDKSIERSVLCNNGSLYIMKGKDFQNQFKHEIPRCEAVDPRISITFRIIKEELLKDVVMNSSGDSPGVLSPISKALPCNIFNTDFVKSIEEDFTNSTNISDTKTFIINTITNAVKSMVESIYRGLEERVNKVEQSIESQKVVFENYKVEINKKIEIMENTMDEQEQYSKRLNVLIFGCNEYQDESCDDIVESLARDTKMVWLTKNRFQRAHRIGRKSHGKSRAIIVRFINYRDKEEFIRHFNQFHKNTHRRDIKKVGVKEQLTKVRFNIFNKLMNLKQTRNVIKFVSTIDGNLKVTYLKDNLEKFCYIKNMYDFEKFKCSL